MIALNRQRRSARRSTRASSQLLAGLDTAAWSPAEYRTALETAGGDRALALVRDAARRSLDLSPNERQATAALLIVQEHIVEFPSGEGKTLAAAMAAAILAASGRRVHVMTANDYLADRDRWWMAPLYQRLGRSVGAVLDHMYDDERRIQYQADVVYGTLREFAFDRLRDRMRGADERPVQTPLDAAIVDEADQTLLDEATTPLVISGEAALNSRAIRRADRAVRALVERQAEVAQQARSELAERAGDKRRVAALALARALMADPTHEDALTVAAGRPALKRRAAGYWEDGHGTGPDPRAARDLPCALGWDRGHYTLLAEGVRIIEERLGPVYENALSDGRRSAAVHQVHQLMTAHLLLRRDEDYVVSEGRVVLLDRTTGRPRPETRYRYGLQPAVEVKEGLEVQTDAMTRASTSVPGFVGGYRSLAGITATARAGEAEFGARYGRPVTPVPPATPSRRLDLPTRIYPDDDAHLAAVVDEVQGATATLRPVLVSTRSVAGSLRVSAALAGAGIEHELLNADTGLAENAIIQGAGAPGAVTVVTNMAGRGTDVVLEEGLEDAMLDALAERVRAAGGARIDAGHRDAAQRVAAGLAERGVAAVSRGNAVDAATPAAGRRRPEFAFGLGLLVVSCEFNPCARVDAQIRGRAGRQGEHGETVALLSLGDPLLAEPAGGAVVQGRASSDRAGRRCWSGPAVERRLARRRRDDAEEARARRSVALEYAAVSDAQGERYHRLRRMLAEPVTGERIVAAAGAAAGALTARHFPGLSADDYEARFDALALEVGREYGADAEPLWGESLDLLEAMLADLLAARAMGNRDAAVAGWDVILPQCDGLWENHLEDLWNRAAVSQLDAHGLKTAVAEYVIAAARSWDEFEDAVNDLVLRHWCHAAGSETPTDAPDPRVPDITRLLASVA